MNSKTTGVISGALGLILGIVMAINCIAVSAFLQEFLRLKIPHEEEMRVNVGKLIDPDMDEDIRTFIALMVEESRLLSEIEEPSVVRFRRLDWGAVDVGHRGLPPMFGSHPPSIRNNSFGFLIEGEFRRGNSGFYVLAEHMGDLEYEVGCYLVFPGPDKYESPSAHTP